MSSRLVMPCPGKSDPVGVGDAHALDLDRLVVPGRVDGDDGRWLRHGHLAGCGLAPALRRRGDRRRLLGISATTPAAFLSLRRPL